MSLNVLAAGEGRPILLLHGFLGSARTWARQMEAWSVDHRVIAPDLLGHGGSAVSTDPAAYGLERQADALAELLDLLDAVPATVVGYSMGARLALVLALAHPGSVERLLLESPSAGIADADARSARRLEDERLADALERDGMDLFVDRWEALPMFASQRELSPAVRQRLRAERTGHDPRGPAGSLRGAGQGAMTPLHDRLAEVEVPTVVLAGALDPVGLERATEIADAIPGARFEIIAEAGHTPHLERADAFDALADAFIRSGDGSIQATRIRS